MLARTQPPQLPARTYPRSPLALYSAPAVTRPLPSYERYRVLLAFFRRLSFTLTLTGSGLAILVYLWRRYFLPRWTETNKARSALAVKQVGLWDAVVPGMKEAGRRGGGLALRVVKVDQEQEQGQDGEGEKAGVLAIQAEEEEEILDLSAPLPALPEKTPSQAEDTTEPEAPPSDSQNNSDDGPPRSPRPAALDLSKLLHAEEYASHPLQLANKNALPASSKIASALLTSLSSFNADISTQTFLAGAEGEW
ncbi:unnamed protein product [Tilletia laevis]|nr:unnamed protein product [Tilletia laevis]